MQAFDIGALHYTALHYTTLQYTALYHTALHCTTLHTDEPCSDRSGGEMTPYTWCVVMLNLAPVRGVSGELAQAWDLLGPPWRGGRAANAVWSLVW